MSLKQCHFNKRSVCLHLNSNVLGLQKLYKDLKFDFVVCQENTNEKDKKLEC